VGIVFVKKVVVKGIAEEKPHFALTMLQSVQDKVQNVWVFNYE